MTLSFHKTSDGGKFFFRNIYLYWGVKSRATEHKMSLFFSKDIDVTECFYILNNRENAE